MRNYYFGSALGKVEKLLIKAEGGGANRVLPPHLHLTPA